MKSATRYEQLMGTPKTPIGKKVRKRLRSFDVPHEVVIKKDHAFVKVEGIKGRTIIGSRGTGKDFIDEVGCYKLDSLERKYKSRLKR